MTTQTLTITEFLLARIAEDEESANERVVGDSPFGEEVWFSEGRIYADRGKIDVTEQWHEWVQAHPLSERSKRTLAECDAKRRIVADLRHMEFNDPLRRGDYWRGQKDAARNAAVAIASVYADHPDYREEWRAGA
jgi:hypothetical protein